MQAAEPLGMMVTALERAAEDAGAPKLLQGSDALYVIRGAWFYANPGREVARRIGASPAEIVSTYTTEEAIGEAKRCMSCGKCFDCSTCWSYCQDNAIVKPLVKGEPYKIKLDFCTGCKKCAEECPCGFIDMV